MGKEDVIRKLNYAKETKEMFKNKLVSRNAGITDNTPFSEYPDKIKFLYQTPPKYGAVFQNIMPLVDADGVVYWSEVEPWIFDGVSEENNIVSVESRGMTGTCMGNRGLTEVRLDNLTTITGHSLYQAFENCPNLTKINMDNIVLDKSGGNNHCLYRAFANCSNLSDIGNFAQYWTVVPVQGLEQAFLGTGITSLNLPNVHTIYNTALRNVCENCIELETVDLGGVKTLETNALANAFNGCTKLLTVNLSSIETVGDRAIESTFANSGLSGVMSFDSLKLIKVPNGQGKFSNCFNNTPNLEEISFPVLEQIINVSTSASVPAKNCLQTMAVKSGIKRISFPSLRVNEAGGCFYQMCKNCTNLTEVNFNSLETASILGKDFQETFYGCTSLEEVRFPALKNIQGANTFQNTFYGCTNLKKVYFNSLETAHASAFDAMFNSQCTSLTELHFPASSQSLVESLTGYTSRFGAPSSCQILFDL